MKKPEQDPTSNDSGLSKEKNASSVSSSKLPSPEQCLVHAVAQTMDEEVTLEAVQFDRDGQSISVATLGKTDSQGLERNLKQHLQRVKGLDPEGSCGLLQGRGNCSTCSDPLTESERRRLQVEHDASKTTISRVTCPTAPTLWRWHHLSWPKLVPRTVQFPEEEDHEHEWKHQLVAAVLCGVLGLGAALIGSPIAGLWLFGLSYLAGSWYTVQEVWERLQEGVLDVHFLMLAVAAGSAAIGAYGEGATLLFLFSFSGALEHYALGRTHREIRSLFKSAPKTAMTIDADGHEQEIAVEDIGPGTVLRVRPGEQFPVDAEIIKGQTASDESNLTGESKPIDKSRGDSVLAGTINLWGAVEVGAVRPASQSALQKIIHLIREAQHRKAPVQRFTDKFSTGYTYGVLGLSLAMFFVWWLIMNLPPFVSGPESQSAFYRAMTLLVVSSPCALVLSIPSAVLASIAWAARRGILFRGGAAVEKLAEITMVAMDKTGTLTTGELKVETVESYPPGNEAEVAQLAFSLERLSQHPLARAITRYGKQRQLKPMEFDHFESITGLGLSGTLGNEVVRLGRRQWLTDQTHASLLAEIPPVQAGISEVWLAKGDLMGRLLLRDDIRPQSRDVVAQLRQEGLKTVVLTGDRQATADNLKEKLNPDQVQAELKPEQKVEAIGSFTDQGERPAMIGDGVNDAPSLAASHVGVAMGARGSDAALEQAEIVLMHDRLENFLTAYKLSQRARLIIRQNLVVSLGTVGVLVVFALGGAIPLTIGVLGHEGSTVIVVLNSLRLLFGNTKGSVNHENTN